MRICFSFDDGRSDSYLASLILNEYSLKGTFHITTGFIDGTYITDEFGTNMSPLSILQIKEMLSKGMEISSHGDKHITNSIDFKISSRKISEWTGLDKVGFSVPNSKGSKTELLNFINDNKNHLLYLRSGRNLKCYSFSSKFFYFCYHYLIRLQFFYNHFNKHNLMFDIDKTLLYSVVITRDIKLTSVTRFIKKYSHSDYTLILMFHSICEKPTNKWEWDIGSFRKLCCFVSRLVQQGLVQCKRIDEL